MSHLLQTISKIKIEYFLKIVFKDNSVGIINGKTPYWDLKKTLIKRFNLNSFFEISDNFIIDFFWNRIETFDLKAICFSQNTFVKIDVFDDFLFDIKDINYQLKDFQNINYISEKNINDFIFDKIIEESEEKNISKDSFPHFVESKHKEFVRSYEKFINSDEEYLNIFPTKLNLSETFNFLQKKDIYDPVDFFAEEYFKNLYKGYEESKLIDGVKTSFNLDPEKLSYVIELHKDLHRSTESYKKWKVKQDTSKYNSNYYRNNRWEDDFSLHDTYRERNCSYCMEIPCQCSDNSDFQ
ncbi:hypothetical protein [Chryseobacterium mucoviscidosis]|uniref:hypothetical protein n=1 Tax=Chryseobacterium mucoviscidosis TaxID=1945581 RepID=UPI0031E2A6B4